MKHSIISLTLIIISFTGCGRNDSRPKDLPPLVPCAVTITQDGQPLSGATVSFVPVDAAAAKYQASAITDDTGKAVATTYGFNGVPVGKYKVCVWKTLTEGVTQVMDGYGDMVDSPGIEYRTVELLYSDSQTTPLEIEITSKKTPLMSFDVGKPVKIRK